MVDEAFVWELFAMAGLRWPHAKLAESDEALEATVALWQRELAPYEPAAVEAAYRQAARGRSWPPELDLLLPILDQALQVEPPAFDDAMGLLARYTWCLPYRPDGHNPPSDLPVALDALQRAGVPEVVQRLVAALGVSGVRNLPDDSRYDLDLNQRAQRRDARDKYERQVVPGWRQQPTPGLALAKAVQQFGPVEATDRIAPPRTRRQLGQAIVRELEAGEDDEPIGPDEVAAMLARFKQQKAEQRAELQRKFVDRVAAEARERAAAEAALAARRSPDENAA